MEEPNLVLICAIAFVAVMALLGFEAVVIGLITRFFPKQKSDGELVAEVIQTAVAGQFPGANVVTIEEAELKKS